MEKKKRLIIFRLCDNDYGELLLNAIRFIEFNTTLLEGTSLDGRIYIDTVKLKDTLIDVITAIKREEAVRTYLARKLVVDTYNEFPTGPGGVAFDHDGGSAVAYLEHDGEITVELF